MPPFDDEGIDDGDDDDDDGIDDIDDDDNDDDAVAHDGTRDRGTDTANAGKADETTGAVEVVASK